MPQIPLTPVTSSRIAAYGYDEKTNTLAIEFPGGAVYHYDNFTAKDWEEFQKAESKGSHFHHRIKPNSKSYPYTKVKEGKARKKD